MQLKRPRYLFLERRERAEFSLDSLLSGGAGVAHASRWWALAPHLGREVPLEPEDLPVFEVVAVSASTPREVLEARFGAGRVARLVGAGLLLGDHDQHADLRRREQALADAGWWGLAAAAQTFGRWQGMDVMAEAARLGERTWPGMVAEHGLPPPATLELRPADSWIPLPAPVRTGLDELLESRSTCRNFDPAFCLPLADLSLLLRRVFGAQATQDFVPGATALKKNSPSGGGLHPVEAFVLVQRVAGLAPGAYHYHSTGHALQPLRALDTDTAAALARQLVAGQGWFADAPVQVLLAARFQRSFWKYGDNSKAWRVIQLDAGHLSQNFYLTATELGYGAFVTGALNDDCAERLFEIDGLNTGAVAVCGLGRRTDALTTVEFDPLGKAVR